MAEPIRTAASNLVMRGPTRDVGDAWTELESDRGRPVTFLTWTLTDDERAAIADGANLRMGVWQYPMPPVSLGVDRRQALSGAGARWVDEARAILKRLAPSPDRLPAGYWHVTDATWERLQADGALDTGQHRRDVPTLAGRPLMRSTPLPGSNVETDGLLFLTNGKAYDRNGPTDEAATPGSLAGDGGSDAEARMGSERSDQSPQDPA